MTGIATYTTDHGGDNPKDTRYFIHTFNCPPIPGQPYKPGYEMLIFCYWSEQETMDMIAKMGCQYLTPAAFCYAIRAEEGVDPIAFLREMGARSYRAQFNYSPFAEPY